MSTEPQADPAGPQRLHPASLVLNIGGAAVKLLLPAVFVLFLAKSDRAELFLAVLFVPSAVYETVRYFTVRYTMASDEMVVTEGVITRSERHIPYARVQNVDLVQSLVHRWLGVAEVRLETASGSEPEAVLKVLSLRAVEDVRRRIFADRDGRSRSRASEPAADAPDRPLPEPDTVGRPAEPTEEVETLLQLGLGELVRLGLISNHGLAVVAAGLGAAWEFELFDRIPDPVERFPGTEAWLESHWLAAAALSVIVVLGGISLLSIGWSIVRMHEFRLQRVGDDLRLACGLFTRLSATVPISRIQLVSVHESVLHRLFRRVTLRVETAGGGESEDTNISRKWVVPLCPRHRARELVEVLQPGTLSVPLRWRPMSARGRRRLRRRRMLWATVLGGVIALVLAPWGFVAALPILGVALWSAVREGRFLAWAHTPRGLAYRSGAWTRRTSFVPYSRQQVVSVDSTPLDRRHRMASVRVDTAGAGPAGHRLRVPYLDRRRALRMGRGLARRAQAAGFSW